MCVCVWSRKEKAVLCSDSISFWCLLCGVNCNKICFGKPKHINDLCSIQWIPGVFWIVALSFVSLPKSKLLHLRRLWTRLKSQIAHATHQTRMMTHRCAPPKARNNHTWAFLLISMMRLTIRIPYASSFHFCTWQNAFRPPNASIRVHFFQDELQNQEKPEKNQSLWWTRFKWWYSTLNQC